VKLTLIRTEFGDDSTLGRLTLDGEHVCFTLEDEVRMVKKPGETAIPVGTYDIKPRHAGGMIKRYVKRFPWHGGMLHLQDVPGFVWVYIHIGNDDDDTDGCILVGDKIGRAKSGINNWVVYDSVKAYKKVYKMISDAWSRNERVTLTIEIVPTFDHQPEEF
jgi:hypothetical protein